MGEQVFILVGVVRFFTKVIQEWHIFYKNKYEE